MYVPPNFFYVEKAPAGTHEDPGAQKTLIKAQTIWLFITNFLWILFQTHKDPGAQRTLGPRPPGFLKLMSFNFISTP